MPELRMIVVAGPRIDPRRWSCRQASSCAPSCPTSTGISRPAISRWCRRPHHLHGIDRGGPRRSCSFRSGTISSRTFHVAHRLANYGAGRRMDYQTATPEVIAAAMVEELRSSRAFKPVEADGAARAARLLADLI
jgi:hypothetical protein